MALDFVGAATRLQPGDVEAEAQALGVNPAGLHAFIDTEAAGSGFQPNGRPRMLFEAHAFHQATKGAYDRKYPNISSPTWNHALYGAGGDHQYTRLEFAIALNREAALCSASWGLGQVMGSNHKMVGFANVEDMVSAMMESEGRQLEAMLAFLKSANLVRDLKTAPPNFPALARGYNGPGQVANYAAILQRNYRKWLAHPAVSATPGPVSRATHPLGFHAPVATPAIPAAPATAAAA